MSEIKIHTHVLYLGVTKRQVCYFFVQCTIVELKDMAQRINILVRRHAINAGIFFQQCQREIGFVIGSVVSPSNKVCIIC